MAKIAIVTDSNSGITQAEGKKLGVYVLPMPFDIDGQPYFEDINLTQEQFYEKLTGDADVSTSQPSPDAVMSLWDDLLKNKGYDEIVHIPMSSGLSSSCATAMMLAQDYDGCGQPENFRDHEAFCTGCHEDGRRRSFSSRDQTDTGGAEV